MIRLLFAMLLMSLFTSFCLLDLFKPSLLFIGRLLGFTLLDAIGKVEDLLLVHGFHDRLFSLLLHLVTDELHFLLEPLEQVVQLGGLSSGSTLQTLYLAHVILASNFTTIA